MSQTPEYNDIFVVPLSDGRLQFFAIDTNFQLWSCWEENGWTALTPFPMPPAANAPVAGVIKITGAPNTNGATQLWVTDLDRIVWTCWKTGDSFSAWTDWSAF